MSLLWIFIGCVFFGTAALHLIQRQRLKAWARDEGVRIISVGYTRPIEDGFESSQASRCFYVTAEDREKKVFSAWINFGGPFAMLRKQRPYIVWDNRPQYLRS